MVRRIYVEKKEALRHEAAGLLNELKSLLGISSLTGLRLVNRYDVEGLDEATFDRAVKTVFSEPQVDDTTSALPVGDFTVFAVESLPGQFDQRADSASQCIQLMTQGDRPAVRTAKVYLLSGELTPADVEKIKKYVINPVESREAGLESVETLKVEYDVPTAVKTVEGFIGMDEAALTELLDDLGLAMDLDDLKFLQIYFRDEEKRDPTTNPEADTDRFLSIFRVFPLTNHLSSQSCSSPLTVAVAWMEQALISSLSSSSGSMPRFFSTFAPRVAISIRVWGRLAAFSSP